MANQSDNKKSNDEKERHLADFCRAARTNNLEKAKLAVSLGVPIDQALGYAIIFQSAPIVKWVLEQKADPNRFEGEIAPLHHAVSSLILNVLMSAGDADLTIIKHLLEAKADVHLKSKEDEPKTARQTVAFHLESSPSLAQLDQLLLDLELIQAAPTSPPAPFPFSSQDSTLPVSTLPVSK